MRSGRRNCFRPADLGDAVHRVTTAAMATASATSADAIGWMSADGSRTDVTHRRGVGDAS